MDGFKKFAAFFRLDKKYLKLYAAVLVMMVLYILPIILADRYYNDDLSRSLFGASGWMKDARPLTELVMLGINFGRPLADISPLPLLLGMAALAYSIVLYLRENLKEEASAVLLASAAFLVAANPFLLPDLSYKFDSLTVALSMALAFLAYALPLTGFIPVLISNMLIMLMIFCLFQPSSGMFTALFFIEIFLMLRKGAAPDLKKLSARAAGAAAAAVLYVLLIAPAVVDRQGWRAEASNVGVSGAGRVISEVGQIIGRYLTGLPKSALIPMALFALIAWVSLAAGELKREDTGMQKGLRAVYVILLPFLTVAGGIAPLLFLNSARISDHMLNAVSVTLFFFGLSAALSGGLWRKVLIILMLPVMLFGFSYSYAYGNALEAQERYETAVTSGIAHEIEEADPLRNCTHIEVIGRMERCPEVKTLCDKYPRFSAIVPTYMYGENWIGTAYLNHFLQKEIKYGELPEAQEYVREAEPFEKNALYSLYMKDDHIILVFNEE